MIRTRAGGAKHDPKDTETLDSIIIFHTEKEEALYDKECHKVLYICLGDKTQVKPADIYPAHGANLEKSTKELTWSEDEIKEFGKALESTDMGFYEYTNSETNEIVKFDKDHPDHFKVYQKDKGPGLPPFVIHEHEIATIMDVIEAWHSIKTS